MLKIALTFITCFAISPFAFGQSTGDAAAGKKLAEDWGCTLCHGPDGNGNKASARLQIADAWRIPRISGQPRPYFIKSMQDYKSGKRTNEEMEVLAKQLSDDDIRNLEAWYGSQAPRAKATYDYDPTR